MWLHVRVRWHLLLGFLLLFIQESIVNVHGRRTEGASGEPYAQLHAQHERAVTIPIVLYPEFRGGGIGRYAGGVWTRPDLAPNTGLVELFTHLLYLTLISREE